MNKLLAITMALLIGAMSAAAVTPNDNMMFGMQDSGYDNSQFFKLDRGADVSSDIGSLVEDIDIEAMDIHPDTCQIYALAGDKEDSGDDMKLLMLDKTTGIPALSTGVQLDVGSNEEYGAASFNPITKELWAGGENIGIRTVNLATGVSTLKIDTDIEVESLAWNSAGTKLYATSEVDVGDESSLYVWDGSDFDWVCDIDEEIEAMEYDYSGNLIIATHGGTLDTINPATCEIIHSVDYDLDDYYDIETITFDCEPDDDIPEFGVVGGALAALGALGLAFRRKK